MFKKIRFYEFGSFGCSAGNNIFTHECSSYTSENVFAWINYSRMRKEKQNYNLRCVQSFLKHIDGGSIFPCILHHFVYIYNSFADTRKKNKFLFHVSFRLVARLFCLFLLYIFVEHYKIRWRQFCCCAKTIKSIDNGTVARCLSFCTIIWYDSVMRRMMNGMSCLLFCVLFALTLRPVWTVFYEYNQWIRNARDAIQWYLVYCVCVRAFCVCTCLRGWKWIIMAYLSIYRYLGWGQFCKW